VISGKKNARYKFTGKELDDRNSLNWYDFGARYYDPAIGRWLSPDPLAEKYPGLSPYVYAANNPLIVKDDDGKAINLLCQAGMGFGVGFGLDAGIQMYMKYQSGVRGSDLLKINWGQSAKAGAIGAAGALTAVGIASAASNIVQAAKITGTVAKATQISLNVAGNASANLVIGTVANKGQIDSKDASILLATGAGGSLLSQGLKVMASSRATSNAITEAIDNMINTEAIGDATLIHMDASLIVPTQQGSAAIQATADVLGNIITNIKKPKDEEYDKNR